MNVIINIFFLILIMYYSVKDIKTSILIYIVGTFIAPVIQISGFELSFDIWCFPLILFFYLKKNKKIVWKKPIAYLLIYFFAYIILSLTNAIVFNGRISIASIYATIRFIMIIKIAIDMWDGQIISFVDKAMGIIIFINAGCAIIQMMNLVSVETFYNLYYKETMKPLLNQLQIGYFNRAYGTTGSPVILGGIAAITYTFYLSVYADGRYKIKGNILKMVACIICGILALSKTAILGIPIITVYVMVMSMITEELRKKKSLLKILRLVLVGSIVLIFIIPWMESRGFAIKFYLKYLTEPFSAFSTRYDNDVGQFAVTMDVIEKNFIFGVGDATFNGAFIGDSVYVVLLYHTGIIGLISYLFPYVITLFKSLKTRDLVKSSLLITFFLIATGNSLYLSYWVVPFVAIMFVDDWEKIVAPEK